MKIKIRKAKPEDLQIIQEFSMQLMQEEEKTIDSSRNPDWSFSEEAAKAFLYRINNSHSLIAEADGKPVGYLLADEEAQTWRKESKAAEIYNMYVSKEYRNKGIGTELVKTFLKWCKKNKIKHIKVDALAKNKKGIEFYKKFGFEKYIISLEINPENKRL